TVTTILGSGDEDGHRYVNLFYWASGNDDNGGMMLINRFDHYHGKDQTVTYAEDDEWREYKVLLTGEEFGSDVLGYLLKDIFGFNSYIMDQIGSTESSSSSALNGEDIILGYSFADSSTAPTWNLTIGLGELANTSLLGQIKLQIGGLNIGGDTKVLQNVKTTENLTILSVVSASLNIYIANVSTSGYTACFDDSISIITGSTVTNKSYRYLWKSYTVKRYSLAYTRGTVRNLYSSLFISGETVNDDGTVTYSYGSKASGLSLATGSSNHY
nr:hypothetical protein [Bacilli bacterium]